MKNLENLTAKELKVIATEMWLQFNKNASAKEMIEIIDNAKPIVWTEAKDLTEINDDIIDTPDESNESEKLEFEVITPIKMSGVLYKKGEKIIFEKNTQEVKNLLRDKVIK